MKFKSFIRSLGDSYDILKLRTGRARCVLCAIAKNERAYVQEWAAFHLAIGFDAIVIYDNESTDDLAGAFSTGRLPIEIVPWPTLPRHSPQSAAYNHFVASRRGSVDWVAFLDLDEFLNLKKHSSVKEFLAEYWGFDAIGINWRMFGSSGHATSSREFVIDRFQCAAPLDFIINHHIKTVARLSQIVEAGVHNPLLRSDDRFISPDRHRLIGGCNAWQVHIDHSIAQINHYFTKSREEFELKRLRGRADLPPESPERIRSLQEFLAYDRNEEIDTSILRWRSAAMHVLEQMD